MELVGLGFLLLCGSYLLGVLVAPLLDKWWVASRQIANDKHNTAHAKQLIKTRKQLDEKNRAAGKSRDIRVDELIAANKTGKALQLVEEKLRNAHEQGNETLVQLYKQYKEQLAGNHPSAEK